ncbi:MAG: LicD family protein [Ruminococcaceae bacterium]|nr:LicD family protein [Oscillospiraceae bacterium]
MKPNTQHIRFKNNDVVNSVRVEILNAIKDICNRNNLRYFCFGDLLVGAVHYNDFLQNGLESETQIGLLREEYERLKELLYKKADVYSLNIIDRYKSGAKSLNIKVTKPVVIHQPDLVFEAIAEVEICAFDYLPQSSAQRRLYIDKVKKLCSKYEKCVNLLPPVTDVPMNLRKVFALFYNSLVYGTRSGKGIHRKLIKALKKHHDTGFIANLTSKNCVAILKSDVFPTQKTEINKTTLDIPNTYDKWTVKIDEELLTRTRTIQKIDLVLLKEFDRVCRKIGVNYFICGGTMLGYKRHGGFIPWDDDIDVGMLRADYDKFIKEANKHLDKDFFLQTRQSDPKIPYLFSKVRLNGTSYITNYNELRDFHKGICLDLFPFDFVPNSLSERHKFVQKALFWSNVHFETVNHQIEKVIYDKKSDSVFEWFSRIVTQVKRLVIKLVPLKFTEYMYLRKATKYNSKANKLKLNTVASFLPTYTYADIQDIKYQDIVFEGVTVMALENMDKFLTMQYGDYTILPPQHLRVGHDLISWNVDDYIANKYHIYE